MGFEQELRNAVKNLGGWFNAHAHIDRAYVMVSESPRRFKRNEYRRDCVSECDPLQQTTPEYHGADAQ